MTQPITIWRNPDGTWSGHKVLYTGEDANVLDKLFGYDLPETVTTYGAYQAIAHERGL